MKKPKIVIDTQMLSRPQVTGIGRYISELLPSLLKNEDFEWIIKQPRPIKFYRTLWEHTILPLSVLAEKADILFCPSNIVPLYLPKNTKLVVTIHDVRVKVFPETFSKWTRAYYNLIYSFAFRKADAIVTVSEFSKEEIIKYFPEAKNKVSVIYNGINLEKFIFLNIPRKNQILFIGALAKHKNIGIIFEAFSKVMDEIPHELVIVGSRDSGMPQDEKVEKALKLIPKNKIRFTGKISDDETVRLYNESDFFIFPSIYEGFGLPLLEAMACGCPIIASNRSSIPEVCGDSALFFEAENPNELAEKILLLARNPEIKAHLRTKGLERVKNFSWTTSAEKYVELFKKLV
ncbi:MAG: glycosyltransferase family 1 protein [Brevinematia bacterium]